LALTSRPRPLKSAPNSTSATSHKTLEEIGKMFAHGGQKAWKTKRGESRLDASLEDAVAKHRTIDHVGKCAVDWKRTREEFRIRRMWRM
jgi:hypothetical protein